MSSLSDTIKQVEVLLGDVLRIVNENSGSVLPDTDREKVAREVQSLRERLKETDISESNCWRIRDLFRSPTSQVKECLEKVEKLHQRVKEDIEAKWGARLMAGSSNQLGLSFGLIGARTPRTDAPADGTPGRASTIIPSPRNLNMHSEVSEPNGDPAVRNERVNASDLNEAINTPLGTTGDRNSDPPTPRRRRTPPPPPVLRRTAQSSNSSILSETTVTPGSGSPRRSHSVRRPAPPPPQSPRSSRLSMNSPISPPGQGPLDPATIASLTDFAQQINRQTAQSSNSRILSEATVNLGSGSPRRSHSVRRPAPPPPQPSRQSRSSRLSMNGPVPPHGQGDLDPAMVASLTKFAQQMGAFASAMGKQAQSRQKHGFSDTTVTKTNCVEIRGANVDGLTLNNGGSNNSGAVIHKMTMPPRSPQHVPHV